MVVRTIRNFAPTLIEGMCSILSFFSHVKELVEKSGFSVLKMLKQGKLNPRLMPPLWKKYYNGLDQWDQWRLNELLAEGGGSFALILKKI